MTGVEFDGSGSATTVHTSEGDIEVERVVVAVGPWIASLWSMLGLRDRLDVCQPDGTVVADQRRALLAAAPVPLRAVRHRRPAPRVALAVPLELT